MCLDRLASEVVLQVIGQGRRTLIALGGLRFSAVSTIASRSPLQRLARACRRRPRSGTHIAAQDLGFELTRLARAIQSRLGDEFEQHHAERIHIGGDAIGSASTCSGAA